MQVGLLENKNMPIGLYRRPIGLRPKLGLGVVRPYN